MAQLSKFQTQTFSHWKGLTSENHISSIFRGNKQYASNMMVQLLATTRGKTLETFLNKFPTKEFDSDAEYTWDIIGNSRRNIPIIEARDENGEVISSGNAGVNKSPFYMVFGEDWFSDGNVIVGEKNELYPFRILQDPRMEGSNAVYKVELMGNIPLGVPYEELTLGKRFSIEYSPVEKEGSRGVGDIHFGAPIGMRNEWSQIRIKHKVYGSMLGKKLAVGIPFVDKNTGKKVVQNRWMNYVDYQFEQEFQDQKNNIWMYGVSNKNSNGEYMDFGKSGNVIKMGAGLRQQMEVSNVIYYNKFSLKLIEDALYQISASKLGMNERVFVLRTGERGAAQFHKEVLNTVSGWTAFTVNADAMGMIQKVQSPLHTNALSAGFQFVEFRAPMGVTVKIDVDPFYDDDIRNKVVHPNGGVAESYRYDIMYVGSTDEPNIQLAKVKDSNDLRGYMWGLRNPFTGQLDNFNMSFDEDAAVIHKMSGVMGVFVLDPTRTISIIPAMLG